MANIWTAQAWANNEGSGGEWQLKTKANSNMGDHLGSVHFILFQVGYDWQKY